MFYRLHHSRWLQLRGVEHKVRYHQPKGCPHVRYLVDVVRGKALAARKAYHQYILRHITLFDFEVKAGNNAWHRAVREAQKAYPGTDAWLLSCSASEGGWGRWVRYGGGAYYPGYEFTDEVGNWLQFRWSTFKGFYRHALDDVRGRGFLVPKELPESTDVRAWLSPLGTALAGAWGITHGMRHHWAGAGCQ